MNGFVYKWTNKINGMWYIGSHKGSLDDGYISSGVLFNIAKNVYGIENFERTILYTDTKFRKYELDILQSLDAQNDYMSYNLTNHVALVYNEKRKSTKSNKAKKKFIMKYLNSKTEFTELDVKKHKDKLQRKLENIERKRKERESDEIRMVKYKEKRLKINAAKRKRYRKKKNKKERYFEFDLRFRFNFGKYKGCKLDYIFNVDPDYLEECVNDIDMLKKEFGDEKYKVFENQFSRLISLLTKHGLEFNHI